MAPITCRVVGPSHFGIEGVHVALECKDQYMNIIARFWAFTDSVGTVQNWVPNLPHGFLPSAEPQPVETLQYPWIRMMFFAWPHPPPDPWTDVQADMYLPDDTYHGVILHLDLQSPSYHIRHTSQPEMILGHTSAASQNVVEMTDSGVDRTRVDRTPSPVWLPPPVSPVKVDKDIWTSRKQPGVRKRKRMDDAFEYRRNVKRRRYAK